MVRKHCCRQFIQKGTGIFLELESKGVSEAVRSLFATAIATNSSYEDSEQGSLIATDQQAGIATFITTMQNIGARESRRGIGMCKIQSQKDAWVHDSIQSLSQPAIYIAQVGLAPSASSVGGVQHGPAWFTVAPTIARVGYSDIENDLNITAHDSTRL